MDIKQMNYFVNVVEAGNISTAAKKLHICQPPLSHQMKLIEEELGVVLMIRGSRKITLTEAGELLYKRAKNIINMTESALKEIKDMKSGVSGSISIGIASNCGLEIYNQALINYHKAYPQISFKLVEGSSSDIINALAKNEVELGIVRTPFSQHDLSNINLVTEPMVVVYNDSYANKFANQTVTIQELVDLPLIVCRRYEEIISSAFYDENLEPTFFCSNDDARTSVEWAKNGLGIALVPQSTVKTLNKSLNLNSKVVSSVKLNSDIKIVYNKKQPLTRIAQGVISFVKK